MSTMEFLSVRGAKEKRKKKRNRQIRGRAVYATGYFDTKSSYRNPLGLEYSYCANYHYRKLTEYKTG